MKNTQKEKEKLFNSIMETLHPKRKYIFEMIQQNPNLTPLEIAFHSNTPNLEINSQTAFLKNEFLIVQTGFKINKKTNAKEPTYRAVSSMDERNDLINKRFVELRTEKEKLEHDYIKITTNISRTTLQKEIDKLNNKIKELDRMIYLAEKGKTRVKKIHKLKLV